MGNQEPVGPDIRRERILRVAAQVLAEQGFDKVRLRDVANRAEVSIGLLQHYFETRDELFEQAFAWSIDDLLGRWRGDCGNEADPWRRMVLLIDELTQDPDLSRRCATWTEFCAAAARHPQLREGVRRVFDAWRELMIEIVEEGVRQRIFQPRVPTETAVQILGTLIDGCDMAVAAGVGAMDGTSYRELLIDTALLTLGVDSPAVPQTAHRKE